MDFTTRSNSATGEALFQNERRREKKRNRSADRPEIIDRAVHCELADVTAGEKDGPHYKRIRGKSRPRTTHFQGCLVFEPVQDFIRESGQENMFQQIPAEPPATAVPHDNLIVRSNRRAGRRSQ